jgi:metabolite-proton symporter
VEEVTRAATAANSPRRILIASLAGTTIEFFDFYIYSTAAVMVFPQLFFPTADPASARLQSLATFALAFFARPVGSALFGHFGDRIGRKATLVAALLTMGVSTVVIGALPTYASIGVLAPLLLCLCRLGQGLGLGGEWGGAVLLATENAPPGRRFWYGMFPQLGAPLGYFFASGVFLLLTRWVDDAGFLAWGWRIPFLASALLVLVGLYVRLRLVETPEFLQSLAQKEQVRVPMVAVLREHPRPLLLGIGAAVATFVVFYLMTVFALSWGTTQLGYERRELLGMQMIAVLFFAITVPLSGYLADRRGALWMQKVAALCVIGFGLAFAPLFGTGSRVELLIFLCVGLAVMGLVYGPISATLGSLFPTNVRYTGTSVAFNFAGILGGSLAPYFATWLATHHSLSYVGYYMATAGLVTLTSLQFMRGYIRD